MNNQFGRGNQMFLYESLLYFFDQRAFTKNKKEEKTLEEVEKIACQKYHYGRKCHPCFSVFLSYSKSSLDSEVFSTFNLEALGLGPTYPVMR